jgi:putative redox protein
MDEDKAVVATHLGGDRLLVAVRGHTLLADQPVEDGGGDTAPTPTEIFIASLAGCVAFYAERFLRRHGLSTEGLKVACAYEWAEGPHRVGAIDVSVEAPSLTADRREAFERVIDHCTIHNTLRVPPAVRVSVTPARSAAA